MRKNKMIQPKHKDIVVLGKLLQTLQMTAQGANIANFSLITGSTRSLEIAFTDGSIKQVAISKDLHGLPLIAKAIKTVQGR